VFQVNTDASNPGGVLNFAGGPDGFDPAAGLYLSGNTLFGTTLYGLSLPTSLSSSAEEI